MFSSQNSQVSSAANYIEDCFSTYLYTGNGTSQTITNGVDLATKGGMVWLKYRSGSAASTYHHIYDSARGKSGNTSYNYLYTNVTSPQGTGAYGPTSFNTDGFSLNDYLNESSIPYVGWTFRKQPKFFDVQTVSHTYGTDNTIDFSALGTIGCVIIKRTDGASSWYVWHRSLGNAYYGLFLNGTGAASNFGTAPVQVSGTTVTMTDNSDVGGYFATGSYVVYAYAHNAGGFGLTGTDNVISCGSFTTDGSGNATVSLGYEPQFVMLKSSSDVGNWNMFDVMREMSYSNTNWLVANTSGAENSIGGKWMIPNATGFSATNGNLAISTTYIYIAIRRGPMKVPTSGTSVYGANAWTGGSTTFNTFPPDLATRFTRSTDYGGWKLWGDRLRGQAYLNSIDTSAEAPDDVFTWNNAAGGSVVTFGATTPLVSYFMRRAPSFFDIVCYTGNGTAGATQTHNLSAVPQMMIVKERDYSGGRPWVVYHSALGATQFTYMNQTTTPTTSSAAWNDTAPTSSVFTLGSNSIVNFSGTNYVAYLFATCAGVSKVGTYTGTGTTLQVNCGFTGGARFVLIHRTDSSGDWYVWDTARGIVSGNDPYLLLNSTAAEVTSTDYIDPYSAGFEISSTAPAAINASGGTFIFLAIA